MSEGHVTWCCLCFSLCMLKWVVLSVYRMRGKRLWHLLTRPPRWLQRPRCSSRPSPRAIPPNTSLPLYVTRCGVCVVRGGKEVTIIMHLSPPSHTHAVLVPVLYTTLASLLIYSYPTITLTTAGDQVWNGLNDACWEHACNG
jgi:hypothetical protein